MNNIITAGILCLIAVALCGGCAGDSAQEKPDDTEAVRSAEENTTQGGEERVRALGYAESGESQHAQAAKRAVDVALDWLVRHQDPADGYWDADDFASNCTNEADPCTGKGQALNDVGVTGLALLALLGDGNTIMAGPYKQAVKKAVKYLMDVQNPENGCMLPEVGTHFMYNHAIGTLALCEAYGLSNFPILKKRVQRALDYVHASKNPGRAWRYNLGEVDPEMQNDTSVTGWMVLCLASGHKYGLKIHEGDLRDAMRFIDDMTDSETGRTGYNSRGSYSAREAGDETIWPFDQTEAITSLAMLCRFHAANILGEAAADEALLDAGSDLLLSRPPEWNLEKGCIDYYYWYFGTLAMERRAGDEWRAWKDDMVAAVLENQVESGCARGSWKPHKDPWGDNGGRVYSTALLAMCLESY